jgi:hypothetical protein
MMWTFLAVYPEAPDDGVDEVRDLMQAQMEAAVVMPVVPLEVVIERVATA